MSATESEENNSGKEFDSSNEEDDNSEENKCNSSDGYTSNSSDDQSDAGLPHDFKNTDLVCAASAGLKDEVNVLLGTGDCVLSDILGAALFYAATNGHAAVVKSLLTAGAPVNACSKAQLSPLMQAAKGGHVKVVKLLLAAGANVTAAGRGGWTPLCYASLSGHAEIVKSLLTACSAPLETSSELKITPSMAGWYYGLIKPFMVAAERGHVEIVELLLEAGASPYFDLIKAGNGNARTALFLASSNGHVEVVASLLKAGAPVKDRLRSGETSLISAAAYGHTKNVELLVAAGANIEAVDGSWTALLSAAFNGHVETVSVLIRAGAHLNGEGTRWTPLYLAVDNGHADVVRALLAAGADPDGGTYTCEWQADGSKSRTGPPITPLLNAIGKSRVDIMRILLEKGANVNIVAKGEWTALMNGASSDDPEVVEVLLNAGADPFAQRHRRIYHAPYFVQETALDIAREDAIRELLLREMERRKAAALSVMPAKVKIDVRQEIMRHAYSWNPSF